MNVFALIVLASVPWAAAPSFAAQTMEISQLIKPVGASTQPQKQCHGPDDCAANEYCWTPGVCIPATCRVSSDCAMGAECYMNWCQYGE